MKKWLALTFAAIVIFSYMNAFTEETDYSSSQSEKLNNPDILHLSSLLKNDYIDFHDDPEFLNAILSKTATDEVYESEYATLTGEC